MEEDYIIISFLRNVFFIDAKTVLYKRSPDWAGINSNRLFSRRVFDLIKSLIRIPLLCRGQPW